MCGKFSFGCGSVHRGQSIRPALDDDSPLLIASDDPPAESLLLITSMPHRPASRSYCGDECRLLAERKSSSICRDRFFGADDDDEYL